MDTLSRPGAPLFLLTALKAWRINLGVILPVSEWTLNFLGTIFTADTPNDGDTGGKSPSGDLEEVFSKPAAFPEKEGKILRRPSPPG
jgi:hypothetical protein